MTRLLQSLSLPSVVLLSNILHNTVLGVPVIYTIPSRGTECLYEKLLAEERITTSIFVVSGTELKATTLFEGPVAPNDVNSGEELSAAIKKYDSGHRYGNEDIDPSEWPHNDAKGNSKWEETVDFEAMVDPRIEDDDDEDDDIGTGQNYRDRKEKRSKKKVESKRRKGKIVLREGEPFSKTTWAASSGWYRVCVVGSWYQIAVEIDLRKESSFGFNHKSGHMFTLEQKTMDNYEKTLFIKAAKEDDLEKTRNQVMALTRLLARMKEEQIAERHRLEVHVATNEHSHSRMVLSALAETVIYMVVTAFQIHTIRTWFSGRHSMLG